MCACIEIFITTYNNKMNNKTLKKDVGQIQTKIMYKYWVSLFLGTTNTIYRLPIKWLLYQS